ncbi:MAG: gliding motility-associated C-terminal domain-containing protein, partial [Bacteroidota bacterium]
LVRLGKQPPKAVQQRRIITAGINEKRGASSPTHTYTDTGLYTVSLIVSDGLGCTDTLTKSDYIYLRFPQAQVYGTTTTACNPVTLTFYADSSTIDGIGAAYEWCLTDLNTNSIDCFTTGAGEDSLAINFPNSGDFEITVTVQDAEGCEGTSEPFAFNIISRVIPPPLEMRNVTVVDEQTIEIAWEPYPGTDFVEYQVYRTTSGGAGAVLVGTVDNINTTVFRESDPGLVTETTSYCYRVLVRNTCDEVSILADTESHCTIELETTQGTDEITLDWSPYVGYVVNRYEIYRTDTYGGVPAPVFLNEVPGNVLTYTDLDMFCRDSVSYRVLAIGVDEQFERSFSDIDGNLPFHPEPVLSADISSVSVIEDSFIQVSWSPYTGYLPSYYVLQKSADGLEWNVFDTLSLTTLTTSDTLVSVDDNSYFYRIFAVDECGDVSAEGLFGKSILLRAQLDLSGRVPQLLWSPYEEWSLGVINYQVEVLNDATGEWEIVDLVGGNQNRFDDNVTRLYQGTYCYRIRAFEIAGDGQALSNEVCVTFRPNVFVPNAFTPNNDGKNDEFTVFAPNTRVAEIAIFNRWGDELYRSFNLDNAWDGTYRGQPVQEGVYVFIIKGVGEDGTEFTRRGTVTLLR